MWLPIVLLVGLCSASDNLRTNNNPHTAVPPRLHILEQTADVIEKELAILERLNTPQLLSSKMDDYYTQKMNQHGEHPLPQRFSSAITVPEACPKDCKDSWKKLEVVEATYLKCNPDCKEDFLQEKRQCSDAVGKYQVDPDMHDNDTTMLCCRFLIPTPVLALSFFVFL